MRFILSVVLCCYFAFVISQTVSNVRLRDHTSYIRQLMQKTVDRVQKGNWHAFEVHDISLNVDEDVLNNTVKGSISFTNGFLVSMQHIDLVQSTVQQVWLYDRNTDLTTLELRSTVRMHNVAIGFDVDADLEGGKYHSTGVIVYPIIQMEFALIKNLFNDDLWSRVVLRHTRTTNLMQFVPKDDVGQVIGHLFDWNSTYSSAESWANLMADTMLQVAKTEHPIPPFCYNCNA